jgi:NADH dehydrogenase/NADH:ubiquinone oxidoreductase subunit G
MDDMVALTLNGVEVKAQKGMPLLAIAHRMNVYIPTLCNNDALAPYGVCRMCLVEIKKGGRQRVVTSCNYPAEEGLLVNTDTERVVKTRNVVMELLLARAPENKTIVDLAARLGVKGGRLSPVNDDCILCGMCVRTCDEVVGVSALGFVSRGITRMPTTPFAEPSETCIGCGSCVYICPTNYIKMEDKDGKRYIHNWKVALELVNCKKCGLPIAPKRQLDHIRKIADLPEDFYDLCFSCR